MVLQNMPLQKDEEESMVFNKTHKCVLFIYCYQIVNIFRQRKRFGKMFLLKRLIIYYKKADSVVTIALHISLALCT